MDPGKFKDKDLYDERTGFGKCLTIEPEQKSAIAWHVAERLAAHGDLAMFVAESKLTSARGGTGTTRAYR